MKDKEAIEEVRECEGIQNMCWQIVWVKRMSIPTIIDTIYVSSKFIVCLSTGDRSAHALNSLPFLSFCLLYAHLSHSRNRGIFRSGQQKIS